MKIFSDLVYDNVNMLTLIIIFTMFYYPSWGNHVQMLNNKPYLALCWASPATAVCISGSAGKVWPADLSDSASESLAPGACPGHSYTLSYLATSPPYLLYLTTWQQDTYLKKSVKSWLGRPGDFDRIVCSFDISDESGVRIDKRLLSELKTNWVQISYEQVLYLLIQFVNYESTEFDRIFLYQHKRQHTK